MRCGCTNAPISQLPKQIKWFPENLLPLFPDLSVESEWKTIEETVTFFSASMVDYVAPGLKFASNTHMNDGLIQVNYVPSANMTRTRAIYMLLSSESGFDVHPESVSFKTSSFVLQPLTEGSKLTVDGEVAPYEEIQVHTLPGFVNFYAE